ncbi:MAG TPA: RagB/SusD family nutrient uptake outer membrane protein [Longimicrobiales bacterium]
MTRLTGHPARAAARTLALAGVLGVAACEFDAKNPTAITEEGLGTDAAMTALMNGVIGNYDYAYDRIVMFTGLISDELRASGSWLSWHIADKDGIIQPDAPLGDHMNIPYRTWPELHRARASAVEAYDWMQRTLEDPARDPRVATVKLYEGLTYVDFAELFCEAAYDGGASVPPEQSFEMGIERLAEAIAIAQAASADSIIARANLVLARAHFGLGNLDAALAAAMAVPTGMEWVAHFRDAAGERSYFLFNINERGESTVDVAFRHTGDPRVPVDSTGRVGPDTETLLWNQMKYPTYEDDFIIGKWQEARLIEAEIRLARGEVGRAIALMNEVREAAGLTPLSTSLNAAEAMQALRVERKYELFLEGRRMIDMRRWNEFPEGWQGTCIPVPQTERDANPNL